MKQIILATNIVSELMKPARKADARVVQWAASVDLTNVCVTRITQFEVFSGAYGHKKSERRDGFLKRWQQVAQDLKMLELDSQASLMGSMFRGKRALAGRRVGFADCAIAGIALASGSALATRNVRDFDGAGIEIINPFSS